MKTRIDMRNTPTGYVIDVAGKFGGGYSNNIGPDVAKAAQALAFARTRYLDTNSEGGAVNAPAEVILALEAGTVDLSPEKGARLSYYASAEALKAIQSEREETGASLSGAVNALVLRGAATV
jgi:hypothetical protein